MAADYCHRLLVSGKPAAVRAFLDAYRWWNAMPLRDLDTERKLSLAEMGLVFDESSERQGVKRKAASKKAKA